ncbi:PREDICTED: midkine [Bison bison bison]|uniref:Midkine n=2 Tax=Bovinae TaxID=27592 RepID=A0A6P3GAH3_BISBB|nr:PREDICTED: midkine [Bison bison bison]
MQRRSFLLLALLALLALTSAVAKKKDKVKKGGPGSECAEWTWGPCTPSSKDCGVGFREGTCGAQTQRIRCRVPCNWKKEFGADCKYKFETWGACDGGTGTKARQGTLKKARYNAQCQETIRVTKPCSPKTKAKAKAKKGKEKDYRPGPDAKAPRLHSEARPTPSLHRLKMLPTSAFCLLVSFIIMPCFFPFTCPHHPKCPKWGGTRDPGQLEHCPPHPPAQRYLIPLYPLLFFAYWMHY